VKRAAFNVLTTLGEKTRPMQASFLRQGDQYIHVAGGHGTRGK
jgi:hypothetical protein